MRHGIVARLFARGDAMSTLITVAEFLETYRISRSTAYRLKDEGKIEFLHVGRAVRIRREDAERWYASLSAK